MQDEYHNILSKINAYSKRKKEGPDSFAEKLSLKLKAYRAKMDFSVEDLARALGVTRMQVWRWEERKSKPNNLCLRRIKELGIL